jgi:cell division protein FtsZ
MADDVLYSGVRGVTDLMVMPGLINLDFADIRSVMSEMGKAMMGTGEAEGDTRAIDAANKAISNPLLDDVSMKGARGVLINITGGLDMTLFEVDEAANRVREEVDPEANIIFGSTFEEKLEGKMRVSVVATGIDAGRKAEPKPTVISFAGERQQRAHQVAQRGGSPSPQPAASAAATAVALAEPAAEAGAVVAAASAPAAPRIEPTFIPPKPVEPEHVPVASAPKPATPDPLAESDFVNAGARPAAATAKRGFNLFKQVTGIGRRAAAAAPAARQEPKVQPAAPASQARQPVQTPQPTAPQPKFAGIEPVERSAAPASEDLLDIPAFLRRQAN